MVTAQKAQMSRNQAMLTNTNNDISDATDNGIDHPGSRRIA